MAGLVYFCAGRDTVREADLAALGLAGVFRGRGIHHRGCDNGRFGRGVTFQPAPPPRASWPTLGCWREGETAAERQQRWSPLAEGLWVGSYESAPPMPDDLARPQRVEGHWVRLGDGQDWLVPVARMLNGGTRLPQALEIGADGAIVKGAVIAPYAEFSEHALAFWDMLEETSRYALLEWAPLAVEALAVNYHVSGRGLAHLGLLDTAVVEAVLDAVLDMPTLAAAMEGDQKKEGAAGCDTAAGAQGG